MATNPGSRVVCHEAEGFGRGRIDSLDKINSKFFMQYRQLVDQCYVHVSKHILQHLRRLRDRRTTDRHNLGLKNRAVERCPKPRRLPFHATNNLWNAPHTERRISVIDPLGRVDQPKVLSSSPSATFK